MVIAEFNRNSGLPPTGPQLEVEPHRCIHLNFCLDCRTPEKERPTTSEKWEHQLPDHQELVEVSRAARETDKLRRAKTENMGCLLDIMQ